VFIKSEVSLKKNYSFSWTLFCDSQISLNWIKSYDKNLHLFAHYRSRDTRRNISSIMNFGTSDADVVRNLKSFPLYFVQGTANPSDLLTKIHKYSLKLVDSVSLWQNGYAWITCKLVEMPIIYFMPMNLNPTKEYLAEIKDMNEHIYSPEVPTPFNYTVIEKCVQIPYANP